MPNCKIGVHTKDPECTSTVQEIADRLSIPSISIEENPKFCSQFSFWITVSHSGIALQKTGPNAPGEIKVVFEDATMTFRRLQGGGKKQLIARAVGLHKSSHKPTILDATAGMGKDAFILASLGCHVTLIEQSPIIALLLEDGLTRGKLYSEIDDIIERMSLIQADSVQWMNHINPNERPEIIHLDPMFPERKKSASVKKEMAVFHELIGYDFDEKNLLETSLETARERVIVKRPKGAPFLADVEPKHQVTEKSSRYDIYPIL